MPPTEATVAVIERDQLESLIGGLRADGWQVVGPRLGDGAVVYDQLDSAAELPEGWGDEQEGGRYRLRRRDDPALFGYTTAPQSWKRQLLPPRRKLFSVERAGAGFRVAADEPPPRQAFLGVRACELAAMRVQDKVFDQTDFKDADYLARRRDALVVAVACGEAGATCFCASMGTGPAPGEGYDLLLTELIDPAGHRFVVRVGSARGAEVLARVPHRSAAPADLEAAEAKPAAAAAQQTRAMAVDAEQRLKAGLESPRWAKTAERCLACGNCTMVCPTCFCTGVEDLTDLGGAVAERWKSWNSCFTLDYSYIHGGSVRTSGAARYRQWITHKLAHWHDQFGTSGCVGCGRCITWCPVGIDITEEVAALGDGDANGR